MSVHEQSAGATDEWYTPSHVFDAMGVEFDQDIASPGRYVTPWIPARQFITEESLTLVWHGFVWANPPFGARNGIVPWLNKFIRHANGIALTPDRTSAPWWQSAIRHVDCALFVSPKIRFIGADGQPGCSPAQGTTLMAIGRRGVEALNNATANGLGALILPIIPQQPRTPPCSAPAPTSP